MKKSVSISKGCVACGSCSKVCPKDAMSIYKGLYALTNKEKCIGCGKCTNACPAGLIMVTEKEGAIC